MLKIICFPIYIKRKYGQTPLTTRKRGVSSLFYLSYDMCIIYILPHARKMGGGCYNVAIHRLERRREREGKSHVAVSAESREKGYKIGRKQKNKIE